MQSGAQELGVQPAALPHGPVPGHHLPHCKQEKKNELLFITWISNAREHCVRGSEFCIGFAMWKERWLCGAKGKLSTSFVFGGNVPWVCHWSECELQVLRDTENSVTA